MVWHRAPGTIRERRLEYKRDDSECDSPFSVVTDEDFLDGVRNRFSKILRLKPSEAARRHGPISDSVDPGMDTDATFSSTRRFREPYAAGGVALPPSTRAVALQLGCRDPSLGTASLVVPTMDAPTTPSCRVAGSLPIDVASPVKLPP